MLTKKMIDCSFSFQFYDGKSIFIQFSYNEMLEDSIDDNQKRLKILRKSEGLFTSAKQIGLFTH